MRTTLYVVRLKDCGDPYARPIHRYLVEAEGPDDAIDTAMQTYLEAGHTPDPTMLECRPATRQEDAV